MTLYESKSKQFSYTNSALAAGLNVLQSVKKSSLNKTERDLLICAAVRLSMLDEPSVGEIRQYFDNQQKILHDFISSKNQAYESPIDNEL